MTKRSVASSDEIWPPIKILELALTAAFEEYVTPERRLENSALVALLYLGAFRIEEALGLLTDQFKVKLSLERREFVVIEQALIEKSEGKKRNVAIDPKDPLWVPVHAHLLTLGSSEPVFDIGRTGAWTMVNRISGGTAWPHWFRAQRERYLATAFDREERRRIVGWSSGFTKGQRFREAQDTYDRMNWMFYADRLAKLNESYWFGEVLRVELTSWLDSLNGPPQQTTTKADAGPVGQLTE